MVENIECGYSYNIVMIILALTPITVCYLHGVPSEVDMFAVVACVTAGKEPKLARTSSRDK